MFNQKKFNQLVKFIQSNSLYFAGVCEISKTSAEIIANQFVNYWSEGKTFHYKKTPSYGIEEEAEMLARCICGEI